MNKYINQKESKQKMHQKKNKYIYIYIYISTYGPWRLKWQFDLASRYPGVCTAASLFLIPFFFFALFLGCVFFFLPRSL